MTDKTHFCRCHRWVTQALVVLVVLAGYPLPLLHASDATHASPPPSAEDNLPELTVSTGVPKVLASARDPTSQMPAPFVARPIAPQEQGPQALGTTVDTGGFERIRVVDSYSGINNDPTISLDGRFIAFWSTAYLPIPSGPATDHVVINEVALLENVYWVEIYNGSASAKDLNNWHLIEYDASGQLRIDYVFPPSPGPLLQPGEYASVLYGFSSLLLLYQDRFPVGQSPRQPRRRTAAQR
jgi:hypothetical protein